MEMNEWNDYGMIFLGVCHSPGWMGSVESVGAWHLHAREAPFAVLCTACWSAQRSSLQTAPRREPKAPASRRSDAAAPSVRPATHTTPSPPSCSAIVGSATFRPTAPRVDRNVGWSDRPPVAAREVRTATYSMRPSSF